MTSQHTESLSAIEHVFTAWDNGLGAKDVDAAMALYHPTRRWKARKRYPASSSRSLLTNRRSAAGTAPDFFPTGRR